MLPTRHKRVYFRISALSDCLCSSPLPRPLRTHTKISPTRRELARFFICLRPGRCPAAYVYYIHVQCRNAHLLALYHAFEPFDVHWS